MTILPEPLMFDWDEGNINKNFDKHGVTNQEAEEVFTREPLVASDDAKHSKVEKRFKGLGKTAKGRTLFLSFTLRKDKLRIISVRGANRKEEVTYEKLERSS